MLVLQVLNQVDALSAASVTRRSAGLPIVVRTILANEAKLKQVGLRNVVEYDIVTVLKDLLWKGCNYLWTSCLINPVFCASLKAIVSGQLSVKIFQNQNTMATFTCLLIFL